MTGLWRRLAASWRRWREDRATVAALERLDPRARAELDTLMRMRRDETEFDGKGRSVPRTPSRHVAGRGLKAHP